MKESVEYVEGIPVSKITDILNKKIEDIKILYPKIIELKILLII